MEIIARLQNLRIAPRKVRLVADLIRGKKLNEAQTILNFTTKKASLVLLKLLNQAEANAKNNFQLDSANLFISKIMVNEGRKLKRWRPRARGQAYEIQKKTSHVMLVLDQILRKIKKIKKEKKVEEIVKKEKSQKIARPQLRPELETPKPKTTKRLKKIFRRDVF